jgi:hypothetical protein
MDARGEVEHNIRTDVNEAGDRIATEVRYNAIRTRRGSRKTVHAVTRRLQAIAEDTSDEATRPGH